jgi:hypothetical protein
MGWGASLSKGLHMITKEVLTCEICQEPIHPHPISGWAQGHNAWPLHEGRCCDSCNNLVIAERISRIANSDVLNWGSYGSEAHHALPS